MLEEGAALQNPTHEGTSYAYPADLARFVRERWVAPPLPEEPGPASPAPLPRQEILEELFSACYQASLLREEERTVAFRAILAEPALFSSGGGPPEGLHKLEFSHPRTLTPRELRRLSVAADAQRSLIGVKLSGASRDGAPGLEVWGLVHSGPRWLRDDQGGRRAGAPLPAAPVVQVAAPGRLRVRKGNEFIGKLEGGKVSGSRVDPFNSEWLPAEFDQLLGELLSLHEAARARARELSGEKWAPLEAGLMRRIAERMLKRVISVVREARHGGTVLFVPYDTRDDMCRETRYVELEYPFVAGEPRHRFRDLIVGILNRLARVYGTYGDHASDPKPVGWRQFETTTDGEIAALDEGLFEMAYLIAGLAGADGAVVMSKHHELLGFGGEISGELPAVRTVARALDLEGEAVVEESAGEMGTRHRSAYRLVRALPDTMAVVVSQDGGVRFVTARNGRVTYWEQE